MIIVPAISAQMGDSPEVLGGRNATPGTPPGYWPPTYAQVSGWMLDTRKNGFSGIMSRLGVVFPDLTVEDDDLRMAEEAIRKFGGDYSAEGVAKRFALRRWLGERGVTKDSFSAGIRSYEWGQSRKLDAAEAAANWAKAVGLKPDQWLWQAPKGQTQQTKPLQGKSVRMLGQDGSVQVLELGKKPQPQLPVQQPQLPAQQPPAQLTSTPEPLAARGVDEAAFVDAIAVGLEGGELTEASAEVLLSLPTDADRPAVMAALKAAGVPVLEAVKAAKVWLATR
jgi:hypothetical protein